MRTRPLAVALLLAFAPIAAAAPVSAQSAAEDPTTDMARARFKEGVGYYDKGQFEQARVSFLQAYALKKHPAVLLNLAWSCLKSGHTLEGERYFKEFLTESKDITDKQRADANDGLTQSVAKLGRIDVVAVAGTDVTIDGDAAGTTPLSDPIIVEPGAHTVKFKGPDGATDTDSVTVLAGEKAVARFAKTASAAPAPTPAPTGTDTAVPPSAEPPPAPEEPTPPPPAQAESKASHKGIFAAPSNVVPVVVGGVLVVAGVGVAIAMYLTKQSAQTKANGIASDIKTAGGTRCNPPGPPSVASEISDACAKFVSDNNDVNTDATIGNIAVGVGAVAAAATIVYWLVADKGDATPTATPASGMRLTPIVGASTGGFSLSGSF